LRRAGPCLLLAALGALACTFSRDFTVLPHQLVKPVPTVGVGAYMVRFKDIVVKEESDGIEDGILGASLLSSFDVEIRFGSMTLALENPLKRRLRASEAPASPGG
jgi:hypothetical protein